MSGAPQVQRLTFNLIFCSWFLSHDQRGAGSRFSSLSTCLQVQFSGHPDRSVLAELSVGVVRSAGALSRTPPHPHLLGSRLFAGPINPGFFAVFGGMG